jgi:hypothetical protein
MRFVSQLKWSLITSHKNNPKIVEVLFGYLNFYSYVSTVRLRDMKEMMMKDRELLNQVAEKLERCEYTPIVTTKEELPIWTMLLNKVYEETFKTK